MLGHLISETNCDDQMSYNFKYVLFTYVSKECDNFNVQLLINCTSILTSIFSKVHFNFF